ncbi:F-box/kelch-repeat protein At1g57790-like [Argentina anserina]|uniref:F-box/kelch-repeat protein At1g57790-like n=1 Tax=Argentina anserina TaxID=57926 RepID=UPI0021767046|nr:F-box/kelch-repeat protein At1g57790-like [Potentilla anserina]
MLGKNLNCPWPARQPGHNPNHKQWAQRPRPNPQPKPKGFSLGPDAGDPAPIQALSLHLDAVAGVQTLFQLKPSGLASKIEAFKRQPQPPRMHQTLCRPTDRNRSQVLILQIKNQGISTLEPHISLLRVKIGIENMSVVAANKKLKREIPPPPSPPPPWSDLHIDILVCIMGRLCYVDQIHFGAVCKNWGLVSGVKPADKLPSVLTLNFNCKHDYYPITLYDPSSSITYELDHEIERSTVPGFGKLQVCGAGKNGWLLLADITPNIFCFDSKIYVYNPYRDGEYINLPHLTGSRIKATFGGTSDLTSRDCLFFPVHDVEEDQMGLRISTCRHGDRRWTSHFKDRHSKEILIGVFHVKGLFFCVFKSGMLGSFNPDTKVWSLLDTAENMELVELQNLAAFEASVVESDGEVLLVYFKRDYKPWHIFKLDWLQMKWVKEVSLGKRVLFLGDISFLYSADGEIKDLADRIYYHGFRKSYFYPIKSGIGRLRSNALIRHSCIHYESRSDHMLRVWIKPPTL